MGYPNFGKVRTLTLPYETDMTTAQYLARYGIDLGTIEIYDLINIALNDVVYPVLYVDKENKILFMADRAYSYNGGLTEVNNSLIQEVVENGSLSFDMSSIVDEDGHKRFIEGDITPNADYISGTEIKYSKWTLSGSHLMIVLSFIPLANKNISGVSLASLDLPQWVFDKIYPMNENTSHVYVIDGLYGYVPETLVQSAGTIRPYLQKDTGTTVIIQCESGTAYEDCYYRIMFDLVIE